MDETALLEASRKQAGENQQELCPIEFKPKKFEFSKIIALMAIITWQAVLIYCGVMMAITLDLSPMPYFIGSVDAVAGVVYVTYSKKAMAENMIKLKRMYGYDAESVVDAVIRNKQDNYED